MHNYFLLTLEHLRHYEEVMLFGKLLQVSQKEQDEAVVYLAREFKQESLNYPFTVPKFDSKAALWAAKAVYIAAQLMLYRDQQESEAEMLLPPYEGDITASSALSVDLMLRFLPDIINGLKAIDPEDKLTGILEAHLQCWHYSGVVYPLPVTELDFTAIVQNQCLHQLYIDRVIESKKTELAIHPALTDGVKAAMGIFTISYWNEFNHEQNLQNEFNR